MGSYLLSLTPRQKRILECKNAYHWILWTLNENPKKMSLKNVHKSGWRDTKLELFEGVEDNTVDKYKAVDKKVWTENMNNTFIFSTLNHVTWSKRFPEK